MDNVIHFVFGVMCFYLRYRIFESNKFQYKVNAKLMSVVSDLKLKIDDILKVQVIDIEARLDRLEKRKK